ncbi:MAG: DNA repair protein RecN (Recombination protein N) [Glaciecola sp.]|jgi:DNA repair protein RecN (Recombination protein N)
MLNNLHIQNFTLIEDANINFKSGFSVITGETGAGKSIMLDALGLLLGKRADVAVLRNSDKKCVIEGEFNVENYQLESFFEDLEMEFEGTTIIRREIGKNGKSRAFVNDSPVVISSLKKLGESLIDVHSQNANAILNSASFYYDLLDGVAGILNEREDYLKDFKLYQKKQKELTDKINSTEKVAQELAFKQFQLNELQTAQIKLGEQDELERELSLLSNAEDIKSKVEEVSTLMQYSQGSVLEKITGVQQSLDSLSELGDDFLNVSERVKSAVIELQDIQETVQDISRSVEVNPSKLQDVDQRLGTLFSLVKKFGVIDADGLLEKQAELEKEVQLVLGGEDALTELKNEVKSQEKACFKKATAISKKRSAATNILEKDILDDLISMNMKNSNLCIELAKVDLNPYGCDEVNFKFNANKGGVLQPLSKVASGGEFSRIMLSLKRILSSKKNLPTILFDEIDTGVSGEVADKMAFIMKTMSSYMQVISITHLPQIASKGNHHYKVLKTDVNEVTQSHIEELDGDDRVQEIAQMLSGSMVSKAAITNAKELLST